MAIARTTQTGGAFNAASDTLTLVLTLNNDAILVVNIRNSGSETVSTITDNLGNTYTFMGQYTNGTDVRSELWKMKVTAAGTATITITMSAAVKFTAHAAEFSGVSNIPLSSFVSTGGTTGVGTLLIVTTDTITDNDWVVGGFAAKKASVILTPTANQREIDTRVTSGGANASNVRGNEQEFGPRATPQPTDIAANSNETNTLWAGVVIVLQAAPPPPPASQFINQDGDLS